MIKIRLRIILIQKDPQFPSEKRYSINLDLWNRLDGVNRAGMIMHEILYRERRRRLDRGPLSQFSSAFRSIRRNNSSTVCVPPPSRTLRSLHRIRPCHDRCRERRLRRTRASLLRLDLSPSDDRLRSLPLDLARSETVGSIGRPRRQPTPRRLFRRKRKFDLCLPELPAPRESRRLAENLYRSRVLQLRRVHSKVRLKFCPNAATERGRREQARSWPPGRESLAERCRDHVALVSRHPKWTTSA